MNSAPHSLPKDYWENFSIQESDLEFLYNHLLEIETPQDPQELNCVLVNKRITEEIHNLENKQKNQGKIFLPREEYEIGQNILFPNADWQNGRVISVRKGNNPTSASFSVIEVELENGKKMQFASQLLDHRLNQAITTIKTDDLLDANFVLSNYGENIQDHLVEELRNNPDLVQIAGKWFPRALLVDVNIGHLNLAEAVLDEANGGPLPTSSILEQIELPTDVNLKLTEFSLNLALQEDDRFDEVGPTGEVLWFLRRLEPDGVQEPPITLRYSPSAFDPEPIKEWLMQFERLVFDELHTPISEKTAPEVISVCLTYPHWRAGTLPLSGGIRKVFPSALESPRIRFTFVDAVTNQLSSGWVVRPYNYVFGLREWYLSQGLFPGAILHISKSKKPGEVIVRVEKHRANREWMRTILIGADGGVVFAVLKQLVSVAFVERMAVAIPDSDSLDNLWSQSNTRKTSLEAVVLSIMRELSKLNPQGHVHAQELYAAVNTIRRCPPGPILTILMNCKWANHLGDLYFRLIDEDYQETHNDE
jgi:hypothetical protein